jgi:hypothetical protein
MWHYPMGWKSRCNKRGKENLKSRKVNIDFITLAWILFLKVQPQDEDERNEILIECG